MTASGKADAIQELKRCRRVPPRDLSFRFEQSDEVLLLEEYGKTQNLSERVGLIWTLARIGGEKTTMAFINTMTKEFEGRTLEGFENRNNNQVSVMETISHCMGFVAQRDEKAWKFLQESTEPSYWQRAITWKSSMGPDLYGILAGHSIAGLGMSGRSEVPEILQRLKTSPPVDNTIPQEMRDGFEGEILQAAYYYDLLQEKGANEFFAWFSRSRDIFDEDGSWARWCASPTGLEWRKWADQKKDQTLK